MKNKFQQIDTTLRNESVWEQTFLLSLRTDGLCGLAAFVKPRRRRSAWRNLCLSWTSYCYPASNPDRRFFNCCAHQRSPSTAQSLAFCAKIPVDRFESPDSGTQLGYVLFARFKRSVHGNLIRGCRMGSLGNSIAKGERDKHHFGPEGTCKCVQR